MHMVCWSTLQSDVSALAEVGITTLHNYLIYDSVCNATFMMSLQVKIQFVHCCPDFFPIGRRWFFKDNDYRARQKISHPPLHWYLLFILLHKNRIYRLKCRPVTFSGTFPKMPINLHDNIQPGPAVCWHLVNVGETDWVRESVIIRVRIRRIGPK